MKQKSPVSIGNRIKSTRMLSGLSRADFCKKTGLSLPTLSAWESPPQNRNGLTEKGANLLVDAFFNLGILCEKNWLLYGEGYAPKLLNYDLKATKNCDENIHSIIEDVSSSYTWGNQEATIKDIESFKKNNSNAIIYLIQDNLMLPCFPPDTYVGGSKSFDHDIQKLIGKICIIKIKNAHSLVRQIYWKNKNKYLIGTVNINNKQEVKLIEIEYAAEIVWTRKR